LDHKAWYKNMKYVRRMRVYAEVCLTEDWRPNDGIEIPLVWV